MSKVDKQVINDHGPLGFMFFVAWVGAFIYFLQDVHNFGEFLLAFLKACVWPAYVVYHVLKLLGA